MSNIYTLLVLVVISVNAHALSITDVAHQPIVFDPSDNKQINIHFSVSDNCDVVVNIYDDRDLLVRSIGVNNLKRGEHTVAWNGKDNIGRFVPDEAYKYIINASNETNNSFYDVSDITGNVLYQLDNVNWNNVTKQLHYQLKKPSRVFVRVGFQNNGPLLSTPLNWKPRPAGILRDAWDGKDASGILDLTKHPKLLISAQAYTLPDNTIIVKSRKYSNKTANLLVDYPWGKVSRNKKKHRKSYIFSPQTKSPELRGDFPVDLVLPETVKKDHDGTPLVTGVLPVRLEVPDEYREIILSRRAEPVFYIDGHFMYENEVGFMPVTWKVDTSTLNQGLHYLTVNLRGYEGNFGIATTKIYVKR